MVHTFGSPAIYLMLTSGFATSVWNACARRDGPSTLAMAVAGLVAAHLAGLPAWLLVWGCTIVTVAVGMSLVAVLLRWISGSEAYRVGLIGTIGMALLLVVHHERPFSSPAAALSDQSLAFGSHLHQQVEVLLTG